jgi:hypothetical protein
MMWDGCRMDDDHDDVDWKKLIKSGDFIGTEKSYWPFVAKSKNKYVPAYEII